MEYNFSKLWIAQFFGFYNFKDFYEYASDRESQSNYYKRLGAVQFDMHGEAEIETSQFLLDAHIESNKAVLKMIKNQLIVFLFTRYEFIIQDAVKCLLCNDPERILKLIEVYSDYKDVISFSLKEFVKYESKEKYVTIISERLSSKILSNKPSKVTKRIRCILDFEKVDTSVLDELMDKRNNIVHEGKVYEIELDELEVYYEAIENLLKILATALRNIHIPVIDEGGILSEDS